MGSRDDTQQQISKYVHFVKNVLKPKLSNVESEASIVRAEITNYEELTKHIKDRISAGKTLESIKSIVDLGNKTIFCRATVEDPSKLMVKVGMGFYVELTPEDASKFAKKRISFLKSNKLKEKESEMIEIKRHIQSASNILDQLHSEMESS